MAEPVDTDNINSAETKIDKSKDIAMSDDNDSNSTVSARIVLTPHQAFTVGNLISKILWNHTILWFTYISLPTNRYECESANLATIHRYCISGQFD